MIILICSVIKALLKNLAETLPTASVRGLLLNAWKSDRMRTKQFWKNAMGKMVRLNHYSVCVIFFSNCQTVHIFPNSNFS